MNTRTLLATIAVALTMATGVSAANLIARYNLDGNSLDSGGSSFHGIDTDMTYIADGTRGTVASFNGSSSSIDVSASSFSITEAPEPSDWGISFWFKPTIIDNDSDSNNDVNVIMGGIGRGVIEVVGDGSWGGMGGSAAWGGIGLNSGGGAGSTQKIASIDLYDGNWHHIVIGWEDPDGTAAGNVAADAIVYIDNQLAVDANTNAYNGNGSAGTFVLGGPVVWSNGGAADKHYLGLLSDVRLFDDQLTAQEVDNIFNESSCNPGDTDNDGDIDTGDLTTAITNFTGAGGSGKTCADGDTDDDGDVDTGDLTFSITNFTGAQAGNAGVPDLVYDPATGNVTIDADGADVISFSLQSGPFNAADFSDLPAGLTDNIASQIGWTSFNLFSGLTGTANLGPILPAGLDQAGLEAALTTASYGLALAGGGGGGRLDLIIPEPASMVMMGLGAMALVRRRRAA